MNSRIRQFLHDEWLQLVIILVPAMAALAAMPYATEQVPMQWNLRGQVNWYAPKEWGLLVVPGTMLLIYGIMFWLEAKDRYRLNEKDGTLTSHGKATRTIRLAISVLVAGVCFVQIAAATGRHPDVGRLVSAACPLLLAFVGNWFGKLKPNRYIGIRVPWTLKSEVVWRKTHRVAGWLYTVTGLIVAGLCMFLPSQYLVQISLAWIAVIVLVPLAVAWRAAREEGTPQVATAVKGLSWKVIIEILILLGLLGAYFRHVASDPKHAPERKAAQAAAAQWLGHLDESRYADAWKATGSDFRRLVKEQAEVEALNKYRKPAGATVSRKLREARYTESLPKAPAGKYVVVQFDTVFEHKPDAVETVVEVLEADGRWQVSGYFIR